MVVSLTSRRVDTYRQNSIVMIRMDYEDNDTTVTVPTGLRKIRSFDVSPTSVADKYVTTSAVSGGTITLTVTDSGAACYLYVTAHGT
jgi:hypothetical protein